ncbi:MAG: hypothetical protein J5493_00945 [Lachnospiraceae bacterium]|nr:hypothetical protein [Lachnospiraceae bacterium]
MKELLKTLFYDKKPVFRLLLAALIMITLTASCAGQNGKESSLAPTEPLPVTEAPTETPTEAPTEMPPETSTAVPTAPSTTSATAPDSPLYPYDLLGVMSGRTAMPSPGPDGSIISDADMQTPAADNEVKAVYFAPERNIRTENYRFTFEEGPEHDHPCTLRAVLNNGDSTGYVFFSRAVSRADDFAYLYQYTACRTFRPLEQEERKTLPAVPLAWFLLEPEPEGETDVFALTDEGYLVHASGLPDDEWPYWTDDTAHYDAISEEPLPEAVWLRFTALAVRYLDSREFAHFPFPYTEITDKPEEVWLAEVECEGKKMELAGREISVLAQLCDDERLEASSSEEAVYRSGAVRPEELPGVIRITVRNPGAEGQNPLPASSLWLTPDGRLLTDRYAISFSSAMSYLSFRALYVTEYVHPRSESVYETFRTLLDSGEVPAAAAKTIPLSNAQIQQGDSEARDLFDLPGLYELLCEDRNVPEIEDFVLYHGWTAILLDRGHKQLIIYKLDAQTEEEKAPRCLPLEFCRDPRMILMDDSRTEVFVLDDSGVYWLNDPFEDAENWRSVPMPEELSADAVEDMLFHLSARENEVVLVTGDGTNYGMIPEEEEPVFRPTETGYHREEGEKGPQIRVENVIWILPKTGREIRIISADSSYLTLALIDRERKQASLRIYPEYREAPLGAGSATASQIDLSDCICVPARFIRSTRYGFHAVLLLRPEGGSLAKLKAGWEKITPPEKDLHK